MEWTSERRAAAAERMRARWAQFTPEQRQAHIEKIAHGIRGGVRTKAHTAKLVAAWHEAHDRGFDFKSRRCRYCDEEFTPRSGRQEYCTIECRLDHRPAARHKLTGEEYRRLFEAQDGRCALCGRDYFGWGGGRRPLVVDHCHETGKVRGLLCGSCNTALGRFGDNPARLRQAADYLESKPSR